MAEPSDEFPKPKHEPGKPKPTKRTDSEKQDVVFMHGATDDGEGIKVLRAHEGRIEAGELRALKHGVPINGDVVNLTQREEHPALWDVDVQCSVPTSTHAGPARVTSQAYRENWDEIFKRSTTADAKDDEPVLN